MPAPEAPHEGDELAGSDTEVDVGEGRGAHRRIAHGHVPEPDLSGGPLGDDGSAGPVVERFVEERLDPAERVAGALQLGPDPGGPDDRGGKPHRDEVEGNQLPEADLVRHDEAGPVPEDSGGEEPLHEIGRVGDAAREPMHPVLDLRGAPDPRLPAAIETVLERERPDGLEVDHGLGHHELRVLPARRCLPGPTAHGRKGDEHDGRVDGDPGDRDGRQPHVHEEQQGGEEHGEDDVRDVGHRQARDERPDPLHLLKGGNHRCSGTGGGERTIQEVPVQALGEGRPRASRGTAEQALTRGRKEELESAREHDRDRDDVQRLEGAVDDDAIDDQQQGDGGARARGIARRTTRSSRERAGEGTAAVSSRGPTPRRVLRRSGEGPPLSPRPCPRPRISRSRRGARARAAPRTRGTPAPSPRPPPARPRVRRMIPEERGGR